MKASINPANQFKTAPKHYDRLNKGLGHTDFAINFIVPDMNVEETELQHYMTLMLDVDGEIVTRTLGPAVIFSNERYFEWKVATILQLMHFRTVRYGGAKPDIVAFHIAHPTQSFDVEVTLQSKYDGKKYSYDLYKFQRYLTQHNFKRLLIVSASDNIEKNVLENLRKTKEPVTLISFHDLFYLYKELNAARMTPDSVYSKLTETGFVKLSKPSFVKPCIIPSEEKRIWVELPGLLKKTAKDRKLKMVYIRDTTIDDVGKILVFADENEGKYVGRQKFHTLLQEHFKYKRGVESLSVSTLHNPQNWDITFIHLGLLDDGMRITEDGTELAHYYKKDRQKFKSRLAWLVLVRGNAVELLHLLDEVQQRSSYETKSDLKDALLRIMLEKGLCGTEGSGRKAIENTLRWIYKFDLITWEPNMKRYVVYWRKINELIEKGDFVPKTQFKSAV
jgi:hypothetical protein